MNIILIGAPASGKGTQANLLAQKFDLLHISTGDMIRDIIRKDGQYSNELKNIIDSGELVPDNLIIDILKMYLNTVDSKKGILFDGFPRTVRQAEELEKIVDIDYVFEIEVSLETVIKRIEQRLICSGCGMSYNSSKHSGDICESCGGKIKKRTDDTQETVTVRYNNYCQSTYPVVKYFHDKSSYHQIDGEKSTDEVNDQICKIIGSK